MAANDNRKDLTMAAAEEDAIQCVVDDLKARGLVDTFRRNYLDTWDQNVEFKALSKRIDRTVRSYLNGLPWAVEMNRNTERNFMRRRVLESSYYEKEVEKLLEKCVAESETYFLPKIEEAVDKYLGIETSQSEKMDYDVPGEEDQNQSEVQEDSEAEDESRSSLSMDLASTESEESEEEGPRIWMGIEEIVRRPPPSLRPPGVQPGSFCPSLIPDQLAPVPSLLPSSIAHLVPNYPPPPIIRQFDMSPTKLVPHLPLLPTKVISRNLHEGKLKRKIQEDDDNVDDSSSESGRITSSDEDDTSGDETPKSEDEIEDKPTEEIKSEPLGSPPPSDVSQVQMEVEPEASVQPCPPIEDNSEEYESESSQPLPPGEELEVRLEEIPFPPSPNSQEEFESDDNIYLSPRSPPPPPPTPPEDSNLVTARDNFSFEYLTGLSKYEAPPPPPPPELPYDLSNAAALNADCEYEELSDIDDASGVLDYHSPPPPPPLPPPPPPPDDVDENASDGIDDGHEAIQLQCDKQERPLPPGNCIMGEENNGFALETSRDLCDIPDTKEDQPMPPSPPDDVNGGKCANPDFEFQDSSCPSELTGSQEPQLSPPLHPPCRDLSIRANEADVFVNEASTDLESDLQHDKALLSPESLHSPHISLSNVGPSVENIDITEDDELESPAFEAFGETSPPRIDATDIPELHELVKDLRHGVEDEEMDNDESDMDTNQPQDSTATSEIVLNDVPEKECSVVLSRIKVPAAAPPSIVSEVYSVSNEPGGLKMKFSCKKVNESISKEEPPPEEKLVESEPMTSVVIDGEEIPITHFLEIIPSLKLKIGFYSKYMDPLLMEDEVSVDEFVFSS